MQVSQVATAEQVIQFATTHAAQVAALGLFPAAQVVQAVALVQVVQTLCLTTFSLTQLKPKLGKLVLWMDVDVVLI